MRNQDKFYELLGALQEGVSLAGTFALGALGLACEGAEMLADTVRLRYQAARVEGELDAELLEAGELAYASYSGNTEVGDVMEEKMRAIDGLKLELEALNDQLGRTANGPICSVCGAAVEESDHFCRSCGEKLGE